MSERRTWRRFGPIIVIQGYLWFTVFLFAFGPWQWRVPNPVMLYGFLTLAHLSLLAGYISGSRRPGRAYSSNISIKTLLGVGVATSLLVFVPTNLLRTGDVLPDIMKGFNNPGSAYDDAYQLEKTSPYIEYIRFFLGPLLALPVPLGIFYWSSIGRALRVGVILVALSTVAMYVAMGTNKAVADTLLVVPWLIAASIAWRRRKVNRRSLLLVLIVVAIASMFAFDFFSHGMATRGGGASQAANGRLSQVDITVDYDNLFIRGLSDESKIGVVGISVYVGEGYQALSMCLEEPWVPTYGFGSSFFLTRQAERLTGVSSLWKQSYPARIEYRGWDSYALWSSIYPWLASDLSFPGVLVAVFLVGWAFGAVWRDVLVGKNPFAVVLFSQLMLMLFYFPANNQIMQSGEGLAGFVGVLVAWLRTRGRRQLHD